MDNSIEPLPIFQLPDWAQWFAWAELSLDLKVQILSLKYPRWGSSFYPIFLDRENQPLFDLPKNLSAAASDGRIWQSCPSRLKYSSRTSQIVLDQNYEGEHPRPAAASRLLISPPHFKVEIIESHSANYGSKLNDPAGDIVPQLSVLTPDFQERPVIVFKRDVFAPRNRKT